MLFFEMARAAVIDPPGATVMTPPPVGQPAGTGGMVGGGVGVGVPVGVAVGEPVGVAVGEPVGVAEGVAEGVGVGLAFEHESSNSRELIPPASTSASAHCSCVRA